MNIKYEYKGHKCPFKARVWDYDDVEMVRTVVMVVEGFELPFITVDLEDGSESRWKHCEPIKEPEYQPYSDPINVPLLTEVRLNGVVGRSWEECNKRRSIIVDAWRSGTRVMVSVGGEKKSAEDLLANWKTVDGEPCGEVLS